jgi:tRNA nucleotidyltransferase (CCA-adding enzyme)
MLELKQILKRYGFVDEVGASFGILKFRPFDAAAKIINNINEINKNRVGLIMTIGIPGSGKSTWINSINEKEKIVVVSTDDIRRELTGDVSDQSRNKEVWAIAAERTKKFMKEGYTVILDATNVITKDRIKFIANIHEEIEDFDLYYKIFEANLELSKERIKRDIESGKDRANVPFDVIDRLYRNYLESISFIQKAQKLEEPYDFSIPRRENKIGKGHKGFVTEFDKSMTIEEASSRRDFTFNSLGYDPLEKIIYDYYGGIKDLKEGYIRHTSDKFSEDPLRIFRAMQFQSRLGLKLHPSTAKLIREMVDAGMIDELAPQRIADEWMKWATKGSNPHYIFDFLRETGLGDRYYPELMKLKETPQDPLFHPEGDVEIHTKLVLEQAHRIAKENGLNPEEKAVLIFAALLHDIAKPQTTFKEYSKKYGRVVIKSPGHEEAGGPIAADILTRIKVKKDIINKVVPLIEHHLWHVHMYHFPDKSKMKMMNRLIEELGSATIHELVMLIEADLKGRGVQDREIDTLNYLIDLYNKYKSIYGEKYTPIISGKDISSLGVKPGPHFKVVMEHIKKEHLEGTIKTKEEAIQRAITILRNLGVIKKQKEEKTPYRALSQEEEKKADVVVVVVKLPNGNFAAVNYGDASVNLPLGLRKENENIIQAAIRIASSHGWKIARFKRIIASQKLNGDNMVWLEFEMAEMTSKYSSEESKPVEENIDNLINQSESNKFIKDIYNDRSVDTREQIINNVILGRAELNAMRILIDSTSMRMDTLPHEYAHFYIHWYRNTKIVKEAIKKWGSEEALVQAIGEQAVRQEGEAWDWWKRFSAWVMKMFSKLNLLTKQELMLILTDAFLQNINLEEFESTITSGKKDRKKENIVVKNNSENDKQKNIDIVVNKKIAEESAEELEPVNIEIESIDNLSLLDEVNVDSQKVDDADKQKEEPTEEQTEEAKEGVAVEQTEQKSEQPTQEEQEPEQKEQEEGEVVEIVLEPEEKISPTELVSRLKDLVKEEKNRVEIMKIIENMETYGTRDLLALGKSIYRIFKDVDQKLAPKVLNLAIQLDLNQYTNRRHIEAYGDYLMKMYNEYQRFQNTCNE